MTYLQQPLQKHKELAKHNMVSHSLLFVYFALSHGVHIGLPNRLMLTISSLIEMYNDLRFSDTWPYLE